MKTHNKLTFLKSKSFYAVLSVAVIAVATVTAVGVNQDSKEKQNQNLVDLNTPNDEDKNSNTDIAEGSDDATNSTDVATNEEYASEGYTNDELLEFDVGSYVPEESAEVAAQDENNSKDAKVDEEENQVADAETKEEVDQTVSVMQPNVTTDQLKFNQDSVIAWPVKGNVIMPFKVDSLVHYATLGEWKVNPAIIISSEQGVDVCAAAKGVVSSIEYDEETGTTMTMNLGEGYEIVYGQLTEIGCEVGDVITEGTVIGKVAAPTKYYSVEGSNLYLKLMYEGTPVNPMKFLAGQE